MANENEEVTAEAPVLNADEQTSEGSAEVASEVSEASATENDVNNEKGEVAEAADFDPQAFLDTKTNSSSDSESTNETNEGSVNNDNNDTSDGDDDFEWPDLPTDSDDTKGAESNTAEGEDKSTEIKGENSSEETTNSETATTLTDEHFKQFANELGLEANNIDEIKTSLETLVKENKELKEEVKYSGNTNKKIEDLENFLKLDDENLMRKSLEADGMAGDKLENVIDKYTDTGLLEVEALKIRSTLDRAIQSERQSIVKSDEADVAKQQESRTESVKSFTEYMQSQDSLFGFKLTGDPDKLPSVRENHVNYVTSGDYLSEITSSEQNLAESSWLWRNRKVLQKAFSNNGRQNGRAEILDKIGNPDKTTSSTFSEPGNSNEFDPQKFING